MRDPAQSRRLFRTIALCVALLVVPAVALLAFAPSRPAPRPRLVTTIASPAITAPPPVVRAAAPPSPDPPHASAEPAAPSDERVLGRVVDPDGRPVAGAVVSCDHDRDHDALVTKTDDDGHFAFGGEAAGCKATAQHDGFVASASVELRAGDGNTLELGAPGVIAGVVVDEAGHPLLPSVVAIESFRPAGDGDTPGPEGTRVHVVDPSGAFKLEGLPPGSYLLTASADGRPPSTSAPITLEAGRTRDGVRLVVPNGAVLVGRVVDADSRDPVAGAVVALDTATLAGSAGGSATTDAEGHYELAGVPPGPFSIRVEHEGHRTNLVTGITTRGAPRVTQDVELHAGAGREMTGIGAFIAHTPRGLMVLGLVAGGPAEKAGLERTDRVLRIDGDDTDAMTVAQATQRLRGAEGSRVTLDIERAGGGSRSITITRGTVVR